MRAWLIKQGEIALSVSAVSAVVVAIVALVDGNLPPWGSKRDLDTLTGRVDNFIRVYNSQLCYDAKRRLRNSESRLRIDPGNIAETYIGEIARSEISMIDGCSE